MFFRGCRVKPTKSVRQEPVDRPLDERAEIILTLATWSFVRENQTQVFGGGSFKYFLNNSCEGNRMMVVKTSRNMAFKSTKNCVSKRLRNLKV